MSKYSKLKKSLGACIKLNRFHLVLHSLRYTMSQFQYQTVPQQPYQTLCIQIQSKILGFRFKSFLNIPTRDYVYYNRRSRNPIGDWVYNMPRDNSRHLNLDSIHYFLLNNYCFIILGIETGVRIEFFLNNSSKDWFHNRR